MTTIRTIKRCDKCGTEHDGPFATWKLVYGYGNSADLCPVCSKVLMEWLHPNEPEAPPRRTTGPMKGGVS